MSSGARGWLSLMAAVLLVTGECLLGNVVGER